MVFNGLNIPLLVLSQSVSKMEENRIGQISLARYQLESIQYEEEVTEYVWQKVFHQCAAFSVPERICHAWYVHALQFMNSILLSFFF